MTEIPPIGSPGRKAYIERVDNERRRKQEACDHPVKARRHLGYAPQCPLCYKLNP